ncbi:uncharacterized protein [Rhodnius prolixus]|uniref:uncharacterized protein n=1 Tax=Rhodnius prolixus TaxID=13249 RepID=UPI003D18998A
MKNSDGNSGWADAMGKILVVKKPKKNKTIILSKGKKLSLMKNENEEPNNVQLNSESGIKKCEIFTKGRKKPGATCLTTAPYEYSTSKLFSNQGLLYFLNHNTLLTRYPIRIFKQINKAEGEKKKEFEELLGKLRENLPKGFKIGAAVGKGDCFFDSVAQGLNELRNKGLITNVKSLRKSCKQYARQVNQSKKGSWLSNALEGEGEELCEYIPRIEFTAEDIKNASPDSEIKILKLENAVRGRPEIEGKMICEKYKVKIKVIELREEQVDGLNVTKDKVGTGNNIIYIVNYRTHFVPLLSKVEKDTNKSIKVSREEAYGNVVGSNSNNISQSYISTPLQDIENSPIKQGSHSRSPCKENRETSRKRGRSATDENNKAPKRARIDVNVTSNEGSEFPSGLQNTPGQDVLDNTFQTKQYIPHHLIGLMYQLDLSVLCSLRKSMYEHKYPSLSLAFGDSEIDAFSNIVLRYKKKSIHIQIENVDKYYIDNNISYARLFTKERRSSSVNSYFGSFVKYLISKSGSVSDNVEYLVVYTNSCLDLTEEKELKKGRLRNFYPFKFDSINIEECDILKDFLFINDNTQESGFYQFSQNKTTREGLLKQLEFLPDMQKGIKERKFPQEEIKEAFLDKLVFAVNQPNREELNSIIKNEIKKNSKAQDDYIALQERILHDLTVPEKHKKLGNYIPGIIYEFNLLMLFLHDMFLHKNMSSISFEGKNHSTSDNITINYKDRITYVKSHNANNSVSYSQLFPSRTQERKNKFSINKHFSLFIEELEKDIEYFIIYTNTGLDLTEEKRLKKGQSKDFYPLKFDSIDTQKKKYKILRDCSCIDVNSLYRFPQKETTKLLSLLKLPPSLQREKEEILPNEKEIKEKFLDKLIFAVNQPNGEGLNSIIGREIEKSNVPYDYEELREITLRWLESHGFGPITKEIMEKLLGDIKNNRSSCQEIQNKNIDEEIKFARSVVGIEGTPTFGKFLDFLVKGEGRKYLEVLEREGIKLTSMSSILNRAGTNAIKAFKDLHNLWFDEKGNKKQYLKTLEENGMNLANMSSVLSRTGSNAAEAFKNLYDLWFDKKGNKTQYLKTLEENGMNLANMSSVLSRAGSNAAEAFKNLYDLWFDEKGNKTQYLKTLEENGMNLANTSNILHGAGSNAVKAFKDLYGLWFDEKGNKTQYLKTLEENGINLTNMSSVLGGAGSNAAEAFKNLYGLWFDEKGNKTQYLKTLEENGINLTNMSSVLSRAGSNAAEAFKNLYGLWFDEKGNKTQYLKTLEENGINLTNMSSILSGAGSNAAEAFKNLHDLWFDEKGNKTQHLETLEENGMNLANMSSVLSRAGSNAAEAFKNLYDLWFNEKGNKTQYLKTLEENGINLTNMSSILSGAGSNAIKAFKNLYDLWFDAEGNKTQYLKTLGENGINLTNMSSVLHRAGSNAAKAFKDLYDLWFDAEGSKTQYLKTLEENGVNLANISSILNGAGSSAVKASKELYNTFCDEQGNKKQHLRHFIKKKGFTIHNLSGILSGVGASVKGAFEKLHNVCFNYEGERTELLDDFYNAGFKPSNLSCMLCGAGVHASSILKRLHSVCFNEKREKTKLLNDFDNAGFSPGALCSMLSGAVDSIEKFHDFYFAGETKKYLNHFLKEGFKPTYLSGILHGARANICSAFKDFHDVCFDETGNAIRLLDDFHRVGFIPSDLSNILTMAGSNAASILRNFHKSCFNKKNHLNHFLDEKNLFTPKDLSKILYGTGTKICPTFEKLHDLCFDNAGNKTNYLNNLIKNNPSNEIFNILYKKVRCYSRKLKNGIEKEDLELAFMRHATSKLSDNELIEIKHLGFRGEALPSIAAVSRIKLSSIAIGANEAWSIRYEGGEKIGEIMPCSLLQGTHIEVRDLFFATPNRLKFLKTERAETQSIVDIVNNLAMINYRVGFTLSSGNKKLLKYAKQTSLFSRLCEMKEEFQNNSLEINEEEDGVKLTGHICKPTVNRGKSDMIYTFVNGRPIKDNLLVGAIRYAYHDFIPSDRYPFATLHLEVPYDQVDVNVHPNKSEVRFQNKRLIYEIVRRGIIKALSTRIGTVAASGLESKGIEEKLLFDASKSQEQVNSGEKKNQKEFYEKRPSLLGNRLMKEFNAPDERKQSLSETFKYRGIDKSSPRKETMVLEREQIDLIENRPLGFARCQVYNTYIIAETGDRLIIVDQHAAHERLVYEYLKQKTSIKRQKLLLPEVVKIENQAGMEMVEMYKDKLFEMGFDIEIESENKVIAREIPAILGAIDVKEMLMDIAVRTKYWLQSRAMGQLYFRIGNSGRKFNYVKHWVEKKVRRNLMRARKTKKGFGWKKWSSEWIYKTLGLYSDYRIRYYKPKASPVHILEKDRERKLQKITVKGVVKLFNAVNKHQQTNKDEIESSGPVMTKKEKALNSVSKSSFLNYLMGEKNEDMEHQEPKQEFKSEESNDEEEDQIKQVSSTWEVLQNNYGIGIKMKNWVNRTENSN